MDDVKYPIFFKHEKTVKWLKKLLRDDDDSQEEIHAFTNWVNSLEDEFDTDDDKYDTELWFIDIVLPWKSINRYKQNEAKYRRAIDNIVELAFSLRHGAKQVWMAEQYLALPDNPNKVKADAVTTIELPGLWTRIIKATEREYFFSWSYYGILLSIITFAIEYKRPDSTTADEKTARNQMIMDMHSALKQRRALGCEGPVFGATLVKDELRFYVSDFHGDVQFVRPILKPYNVARFVNFLQCYFVLCKIADIQSDNLEKHFKRWEDNQDDQEDWLNKPFSPDSKDEARRPWRYGEEDDSQNDEGRSNQGEATAANENATVDGTGAAGSEPANESEAKFDTQDVQRSDAQPKDVHSLKKEHLENFDALWGLEGCDAIPNSARILAWTSEVDKCWDDFEDYSSRIWRYVHEEVETEEQQKFIASQFVADELRSGKLFVIDDDMCNKYLSEGQVLDDSDDSTQGKMMKSASVTLVELFTSLELSESKQRAINIAISDGTTLSDNSREDAKDTTDPPYSKVWVEVERPGPTSADDAMSMDQKAFRSRPSYADVLKKAPPVRSGALNVHAPRASSIKIKPSYAAVVKNAAHPVRHVTRKDAAVHSHALNDVHNPAGSNVVACGHA